MVPLAKTKLSAKYRRNVFTEHMQIPTRHKEYVIIGDGMISSLFLPSDAPFTAHLFPTSHFPFHSFRPLCRRPRANFYSQRDAFNFDESCLNSTIWIVTRIRAIATRKKLDESETESKIRDESAHYFSRMKRLFMTSQRFFNDTVFSRARYFKFDA